MLLAELKGDGSGPAEDKTPLGKDEDIDDITEDDYFIKNAEVAGFRIHRMWLQHLQLIQAQAPGCRTLSL